MKSSIKRLAKDQINLRHNLPPNYFFEETDEAASLPDDLTQLRICLTGPEGTPYSQGFWRVSLNIPVDYPQSPPTAVFQTRIFHPNVAEESGAVCLETLKRDWDPKLTLKDILITISCLLIQPNPDSALNQKAGALIQDDYSSFARQARLMTKIHAPIPPQLFDLAQEARRRGEDTDEQIQNLAQPETKVNVIENKSKPVLRENQPSQTTDGIKVHEVKPRKRSLEESMAGAGGSRLDNNIDNGRRKSPRQEMSTSNICLSMQQDDSSRCTTRATTEVGTSSKPAQQPEKIIFRASWSSISGGSRLKARIGIRRL